MSLFFQKEKFYKLVRKLGKVWHMRKLVVSISVVFTFLLWVSFAEAISLNEAYKSKKSDVLVKGSGTVIRILKVLFSSQQQ